MKNLKINPLIIGLVILAGIAFLFIAGLGGNNREVPVTGPQGRGSNSDPRLGDSFGRLGQMYVARDVDRAGCPTDAATQFYPDKSIYVGATRSDIPAGTAVFARLLRDGQPIEDADEITADQDMPDTCLWFAFQPASQNGFDPGNYEAQLFVNGNPVDSMRFTVEGDTGSGGLLGGGSRSGRSNQRAELGQVVATTRVDNNGCPLNSVDQFYSNESIYVAADESYIPAGTEVFARLLYEGQPVEDTQPIRADQDLQTCVWFQFDQTAYSGGFDPGRYEAEMYVNGDLVDTVNFEVQ